MEELRLTRLTRCTVMLLSWLSLHLQEMEPHQVSNAKGTGINARYVF